MSQAVENFIIAGPSGALEARVVQPKSDGILAARNLLVVVCHPHPQHGGTMDNKVVTTLVRGYRDLGVTAVCFNFRGVGKSAGSFAHAIGEVDDLMSVAAWAEQHYSPASLLLAGFSFGSSIAAQASYRLSDVRHLLLLAPPVERYPYARDNSFSCPLCVIQGGRDERVNVDGVAEWVRGLRSVAELISYPEAGHFFHGYLTSIKDDLTRVLPRQLA